MKLIEMTRGGVVIVDDDMYEELSAISWYPDPYGYAMHKLKKNGKYAGYISMHRYIAKTPKGMHTDHRNGNRLDNRRMNLRTCTKTQNDFNRGPTGRSPYKGLSWDSAQRRWKVRIKANGQDVFLGRFVSEVDAARAYNAKAQELHGEFAYLNNV